MDAAATPVAMATSSQTTTSAAGDGGGHDGMQPGPMHMPARPATAAELEAAAYALRDLLFGEASWLPHADADAGADVSRPSSAAAAVPRGCGGRMLRLLKLCVLRCGAARCTRCCVYVCLGMGGWRCRNVCKQCISYVAMHVSVPCIDAYGIGCGIPTHSEPLTFPMAAPRMHAHTRARPCAVPCCA